MKNNSKTRWVTIPESEMPKNTRPPKKKTLPVDKVENKFFWAAGLVAVVIFSVIVFMPNQVSRLTGNLFDGFEFVPTEQDGGAFFAGEGGDSDEVDGEGDALLDDSQGADAQFLEDVSSDQASTSNSSDAVPIQIDPLNGSSASENDSSVEVNESDTTDTSGASDTASGSTDAELLALLESLSAQLEELKKDGLQKDQEIASLKQMLEAQTTTSSSNLQGAAQEIQTTMSSDTKTTSTTGAGTYRANTHTVTVNPFDVLNQNRQSLDQIQASAMQANIAQADSSDSVQAAPTMDLATSGLQSQPTTGPFDSFWITLLLTSIGILFFGIYRAVRA